MMHSPRNWLVFLLCVTALAALPGCEKKSDRITINDNGIEFVFEKTDKANIAARVDGEDITEDQLTSQSPALDELMQMEKDVMLGLAYRQVREEFRVDLDAGKPVKLVYHRPEPKHTLTQLLANVGAEPTKGITVTFSKDPADPNLVAEANGRRYLTSDLKINHFAIHSLKKRQFREKLSRLQGIAVRRLLLKAAEKEKITINEYIAKKITKEKSPDQNVPTELEIQAFMTKNSISKGDVDEAMNLKIKNIIIEQKQNAKVEEYVSSKLVNGPIVIHFPEPEAMLAASTATDVIWGYDSAPIPITIFSNLLCSECLAVEQALLKLREEHKGQVRITYNHFFGASDRNARMVAEASMCLYKADKEQFAKFHDAYILGVLAPDEEMIYKTAEKSGAKIEDFKKCVLARSAETDVADHVKYAESIGVVRAPTVVIDNEVFEGGVPSEELARYFARKIAEKGDPWHRVIWRRITGK